MAERMTAAAKAEDAASNVSADTILEYGRRIAKARRDAKAASSFLQAEAKRAKNAGVPVDALQQFLKDREKDPDEVKARQHAYARIAAAYGAFETIQQPSLNLPAASDKATAEQRLFDADEAGYRASCTGQRRDANPHIGGAEDHVAWDAGWLKGQEKIAREMADNAKKIDGRKGRGKKNPEDRPGPAAPASDGSEKVY